MSEPRDERLLLRKTNEEVLRKKLVVQARTKCEQEIVNFGECAKRNGLLVVFNCRNQNLEMSKCMDLHCSESEFHKFLIKEGIDPKCLNKKHVS